MNLLTPDQINLARQRVADDSAACKIADSIFAAAAGWLDREDTCIRDLMPEADLPRSFSINYHTGCPVHGRGPEGYTDFVQGGWSYDPWADRWRVTCAVGGETYPSNDFEAYYRTGMQDRSLLTGPYADDGWGWQAKGAPYRHWFIAYCCEQIWHTVISGLTSLYQAYLLSNEARYAHKALVILDRIAEVYPDMDYSNQSMYACEFSPGYGGKMFNLISDTRTVSRLSIAFDAVRNTMSRDPFFGPTAEATQAKLEQGIIGACLDGIYCGQVRGNYGMHQEALLNAALASGDHREIDRAIHWVLENTGEETSLKEMLTYFDDYIFRDKAAHAEGLNFALDNLIFREGIGWESSPSYNSFWVDHIATIAALLESRGVRLWDRPKVRRMFRWATEMTCLGRFTPAIGDMGSTIGGLVQFSTSVLRKAYAATGDTFIGELLRQRQDTFDSFESLFFEISTPVPSKEDAAEIKKLTTTTRLMGGYGLALLRSGRGTEQCAVSLYYGRAATEHGHFDRLNLELFSYNRKLIPDHGYGEHAAEGERPAIWTKNTLSHTTVVVDGRRQDTQGPGRLILFTAASGLSLVEVDAPDTYHSTSEYRRTTALIDLAPNARYLVDLFRVAGGYQHDYSIHGFDGTFTAGGIILSPTQKNGTLAGEEIPYGAIYDDDDLTDPLHKDRSYYTYHGGGYSYLYDVRRGSPTAPWTSTWQEADIGLRMHILPTDEAIIAHGDPPRKPGNPKRLTYLLMRNAGDDIASQFAAVMEPFKGDPRVHAVELLEQTERTVALRVQHQYGEDLIRHAVDPHGTTFSFVRLDLQGQVVRLHLTGLGRVQADGQILAIAKGISGRILSVDPENSTVEIVRDRESQSFISRDLIDTAACIGNSRRNAAYTITSIESQGKHLKICFGNDSFRIGRFVVTALNPDGSGLTTKTYLYNAPQGYYRGARLVDEAHQVWLPVEDVKLSPHHPGSRRDGCISLVERSDLITHFEPDQIAYLYDFGPGDTLSIVPQATADLRVDGTFRIMGNCRAEFATSGP